MRALVRILIGLLCFVVAAPAMAQTPGTSTLMVVVVDQSGAVVKDAKVSVLNLATVFFAESALRWLSILPSMYMTGIGTATL